MVTADDRDTTLSRRLTRSREPAVSQDLTDLPAPRRTALAAMAADGITMYEIFHQRSGEGTLWL